MSPSFSKRLLRRFLHGPVYLYRWRLGWLFGNRFLLLTHVGRRTGRRRQTVLEVMEYRDPGPELVVMSGFGPKAEWLRNIEATSDIEITSGADRFVASYRFLGEEEAMNVVAGYEQRNRWIGPAIRSVLSRLLGWHYRGTAADRRRLVAQLPLIAFRPRV